MAAPHLAPVDPGPASLADICTLPPSLPTSDPADADYACQNQTGERQGILSGKI